MYKFLSIRTDPGLFFPGSSFRSSRLLHPEFHFAQVDRPGVAAAQPVKPEAVVHSDKNQTVFRGDLQQRAFSERFILYGKLILLGVLGLNACDPRQRPVFQPAVDVFEENRDVMNAFAVGRKEERRLRQAYVRQIRVPDIQAFALSRLGQLYAVGVFSFRVDLPAVIPVSEELFFFFPDASDGDGRLSFRCPRQHRRRISRFPRGCCLYLRRRLCAFRGR